MVLLVEIVFSEVRQLGNPQAGIQQGPDDKLFLVRLTSIGEAVSLILG
jgi:hypothetical protein